MQPVAHALRHALLSAFGGYETWTQDAGRRASSLSTVLSLRRICEHSANIRRRRGRAQSPECPRQLQPGLLFRPDRSDHRYGWVPARTYLQTRCTEATGRASCSRVWASKDPTLRTPWTGCKAAEERLVAQPGPGATARLGTSIPSPRRSYKRAGFGLAYRPRPRLQFPKYVPGTGRSRPRGTGI